MYMRIHMFLLFELGFYIYLLNNERNIESQPHDSETGVGPAFTPFYDMWRK